MDEPRVLEFAQPCQAVQIKLTDTLLEALINAQRTGQKVAMNVGKHNEIIVGEDKYPFRAHETNLQDVVRVPHEWGESCTEVAQVSQRLHVQRVVTEAERERVRQRGLEAENQRKGRTAQVLDRAPKPGQGRKVVHNSVVKPLLPSARPAQQKLPTRPSPSPHPRDPTPPIKNPALAARTQTPTPPPNRSSTPPPGAANASLKGRPQSLSKLGKPKKPAQAPTGTVTVPQLAVEAARRRLGLRKVLVACIATDRPKKPRLDQMLQGVANRVAGFKFGKSEVVHILKDIAEYRAPGVYILTDYVQKRELSALQQELGSPLVSEEPSRVRGACQPSVSAAASDSRMSPSLSRAPNFGNMQGTPSLDNDLPTAKAEAQPEPSQEAPRRSPARALPLAMQKPVMDWSGLAAEPPAAAAAPQPGTQPEDAGGKQKLARKLGERSPKGDGEREVSPSAGEHKKKKRRKSKSQQGLPDSAAAANWQSAGPVDPSGPRAALGPSTERRGGHTNGVASPVAPSSSSLDADISWFEEFVRPPKQEEHQVQSRADFDALFDRHDRMYQLYIRLGRSLNRFKGEYRALAESAQAAATEEQQRTFQAQAERYYSGRVGRARQMDTAFKTLHAELTGIKAGLARFFDRQRGRLPSEGAAKPVAAS